MNTDRRGLLYCGRAGPGLTRPAHPRRRLGPRCGRDGGRLSRLPRPDRRSADRARRSSAATSARRSSGPGLPSSWPKQGQTVALVSSGDAGVYGMGGVACELAAQQGSSAEIVVVPGVTAACSAAARLGAPLAHDWACDQPERPAHPLGRDRPPRRGRRPRRLRARLLQPREPDPHLATRRGRRASAASAATRRRPSASSRTPIARASGSRSSGSTSSATGEGHRCSRPSSSGARGRAPTAAGWSRPGSTRPKRSRPSTSRPASYHPEVRSAPATRSWPSRWRSSTGSWVPTRATRPSVRSSDG